MALPRAVLYSLLKDTHPDYDLAYWEELRALRDGGRKLLRNKAVMERLFPRHANEAKDVYKERVSRALYIPYPGEIVGATSELLATDPLVVDADPKPDPFYVERKTVGGESGDGVEQEPFIESVDGRGTSVTAYMQHLVREAMTTRFVWTQCDLPDRTAQPVELDSVANEEKASQLRSVAFCVTAEHVRNWETDEDGDLAWVCVSWTAAKRLDPSAERGLPVETYTFYDRDEWVRFEVVQDPNKPVRDDDIVAAKANGRHSFGRVPFIRFELPEALWAMDKIASMAAAHLNQRNAFSWGQLKSLLPQLVAYLGPEANNGPGVVSEAQQNPARATNQVYGMGYVGVFGNQDKLDYVGPDSGPYSIASQDLKDLRDEMHRVNNVMSLAIENTPTSIGRSGMSKAKDEEAREKVARKIGQLAKAHLEAVLQMVAAGRGDPVYNWNVRGFDSFTMPDEGDPVASAVEMQNLQIPSPKFWKKQLSVLATRILKHDATPEELAAIVEEIEKNSTKGDPALDVPPVPGALPGANPNAPPATKPNKAPASPKPAPKGPPTP